MLRVWKCTEMDKAIGPWVRFKMMLLEIIIPFMVGGDPNDGSVATLDFIGMLSVLLIVVAACGICFVIVYKRRSKAKDALAKAEITIEQSIVIEDPEAQIEQTNHNADGSNTYSSEIDVVTR